MRKEPSDTKRFVRFVLPSNAEPKLSPCDDRIGVDLYLDGYQYETLIETFRGIDPDRLRGRTQFAWLNTYNPDTKVSRELVEIPAAWQNSKHGPYHDMIPFTVGSNQGIEEVDFWFDRHSDYPVADWQFEVTNGDTRLGYWEWAFNKQEADK